jgi:tetraacyldisaccharide 4'-kinase
MAKLKLPSFWYAQEEATSPIMAKVMWPISKVYEGLTICNRAITREKKSPLPIVCIGNLTMGGAGKTPTARAVMKLVQSHGKFATPCFLMRGYGGAEKGPMEVSTEINTSYDVGDEALMQAQYAPVIISQDRYAGALLAKKSGYDLIIMDDGFQNPKLHKDLSLIIVDGGFGFGNGNVFPAGPLRETVKSGLARAHGVIVINRTDGVDLSALGNAKQFDGRIALTKKGDQSDGKKVVAFAGIARPEKFFETLEANGYHLHAHHAFPDHHVYRRGELEKIVAQADKASIPAITTEKDWIRLSDQWKKKISYLKIDIELDERFKRTLFKFLDRLAEKQ